MASARLAIFVFAAVLTASTAAPAAEDAAKDAGKLHTPQTDIANALPADSTTQHSLGADAAKLDYTATAGTLPLTNQKGETTAKVFYTAYTTPGENRPISFVFNGGPGAASAFLHLGAVGPRVLQFTDDGAAPVKPIALRDNPDSWLAFTDLVFVDPVGTGFSRATGGEEAEKVFYGVDKDADAMTDFVRLYLARAGRELARVYVVGESYGGFRAALLSDRLLRGGIQVEGAVLISPALEFSMIRGDDFALVPMAMLLPSLTASNLERTQGHDAPYAPVEEAETFARSDYLLHLIRGLIVDDAVIDELARLTGLDRDIVARHYGHVDGDLFRREYARAENRSISAYDGSVSMPVPRPAGHGRPDPILDAAVNVLTPLMVTYARDELGFKTDLNYELLNRKLNGQWDYGTKPNRQGYAGSLEDLQHARTLSPGLKVFVAHGYTDLVTPYSVSRFLLDQLSPIDTARPIEMHVYRGGHMMYMRPPSRHALFKDVAALYGQGEGKKK